MDLFVALTCIHVLMRDEKEGRKKQAGSNKQQGKATPHPRQSLFLRKMSCLVWDLNPHVHVGACTHTCRYCHPTCIYMYTYMYMYNVHVQCNNFVVGRCEE